MSPGSAARHEELNRHLAKMRQWAHAAEPLGLKVPELPAWAVEFASDGEDAEAWREVLRGVERIAQQRILAALEEWEKHAQGRLRRLEAYSVDSRLEREEIEDALHAARTGDVARALSTYQQVARVVALKERHLDQAREELERLVSLFRDMEALDVAPPDDPQDLEADLERELRRGRLAPLKQRIRDLQATANRELERVYPGLIARYGSDLVKNRHDGGRIDAESAMLARAARAFHQGRTEDGVRELRRLAASGRGPRPGPLPTGAKEP